MLAQEGEVGDLTTKVGKFALGAFDVMGVVAKSTDVPAKVAETVGEEFLEVIEFTSGAVTKVYMRCCWGLGRGRLAVQCQE